MRTCDRCKCVEKNVGLATIWPLHVTADIMTLRRVKSDGRPMDVEVIGTNHELCDVCRNELFNHLARAVPEIITSFVEHRPVNVKALISVAP